MVKNFVYNVCQELSLEEAKQLLNPNEYSLLKEEDYIFKTISNCIEKCIQFRKQKNSKEKFQEQEIDDAFFCEKTSVEHCDLKNYIKKKNEMLNYKSIPDTKSKEKNPNILLAKSLINGYSHPTTIKLLKESVLSSYLKNQ